MSRISSVAKLPQAIRAGLDDQLRAAAYGDLCGATEWIKDSGHLISKSSLGRYAMRLRLADAKAGKGLAQLLMTPQPVRWTLGRTRRQEAILSELVRLQGLQSALLEELAALQKSPEIMYQ